jgi:hypothetical protein
MDAAGNQDRKPKTTRRLADIAASMGECTVNRWRQRLAEINSSGALSQVNQVVQNVQNVQNVCPFRHFVEIEQIEQREDSAATPLAAPGIGTPKEWRERLREVLSTPCPSDMPGDRWECACRGIEQFVRAWAAKAMSLGWTFDELFAFEEPFANVSLLGAAWFIWDSTVTAVTADAITLRTEGGATQRIYRKVRVQRPPL